MGGFFSLDDTEPSNTLQLVCGDAAWEVEVCPDRRNPSEVRISANEQHAALRGTAWKYQELYCAGDTIPDKCAINVDDVDDGADNR